MNKNEALDVAIGEIAHVCMEWTQRYLNEHGCHLTSFAVVDYEIKQTLETIKILEGLKDDDTSKA
jgi:hypothetical protein